MSRSIHNECSNVACTRLLQEISRHCEFSTKYSKNYKIKFFFTEIQPACLDWLKLTYNLIKKNNLLNLNFALEIF
ncbi:hypothetical protein BpHYR1_039827 [Brachionus plicatilis]|uniref:Uncharacterized protein n=1 Tax=Brachionus plicatilis TaxID=10195 RepID=A0A3M7QVT1_BRAPC|nr:hypothetical protein BpHYR1_039827 [Brachionus plicatilis]